MADDTLYFRLLFVLYPPVDSNARSCHQAEIDETHTPLLFGLNSAIYFFFILQENLRTGMYLLVIHCNSRGGNSD